MSAAGAETFVTRAGRETSLPLFSDEREFFREKIPFFSELDEFKKGQRSKWSQRVLYRSAAFKILDV